MTAKVLKKLPAAVVDSSPMMSIFEKRSSATAFKQGLKKADKLYMNAATLVELSVIFIGKKGKEGTDLLDALLAEFKIEILPHDLPMVKDARHGCANYGKGHNKAALNMGDLFSYALAKNRGLPLYFEGLDFPQTDIQDAMLLLGYEFDEKHSPSVPMALPA
jgi:ribonuclease VapC